MDQEILKIVLPSGITLVIGIVTFFNFRHQQRARKEDLLDKNRLIHLQLTYTEKLIGSYTEMVSLRLEIANRSPRVVSVKDINWFIKDKSVTWNLEQDSKENSIEFPKKLEQSEEIGFLINSKNIFRMPWMNQDLNWLGKTLCFQYVRLRVLLTTGEQYLVPLPAPFRHLLVQNHISNFFTKTIAIWLVSRKN